MWVGLVLSRAQDGAKEIAGYVAFWKAVMVEK